MRTGGNHRNSDIIIAVKILLISDTHSHVRDAVEIIRREGDFDLFFHMGDTYQDAVKIQDESGLSMKAVSGNMDELRTGPNVEVFSLEGIRFLLTHGDMFQVSQGLQVLDLEAERCGADVVCFGHTHIPCDTVINTRHFFNPGALRGNAESYGILTLDNGSITYLSLPLIRDLKA